MKKELLISLIYKCIKTGCCKSLKDSIYNAAEDLNIYGFEFTGYLQCINSIDSYYRANMDMLEAKNIKELFFNDGLVYTKVKDEAPTKYSKGCVVKNSIIASGCIIEGSVENSILGRRVKIHKGANIKDCIIMQNCEIKEDVTLINIIMDKNVIIENGKELRGDKEFPLVIEKRAVI